MRLRALTLGLASLALAAAGCGDGGSSGGAPARTETLPGAGKPVVTLGTRASTTQLVLGQLYKQALEARGYRVRLKQNIGSTLIADAALRAGEIDLYPDSVTAFDRAVAGVHEPPRAFGAAYGDALAYAGAHGLVLLRPTPFSDVDAIAVTPQAAARHRLRSIADLRRIEGLRLGAPPAFHDAAAGLPGLARAYGIDRVRYAPLTTGLQYPALDDDKLDAAVVRTTDGELADGDYVLLEDPQQLFGFEPLVPIASARVVQALGRPFVRTLDAVTALLTTRTIQQLNAKVAIDGRSPEDVARELLRAKDLA